jgi:hypothetical protein
MAGLSSAPGTGCWASITRRGTFIVDRYPNIADHGLIGDLQTAALVTTTGTIDWFCCRDLTRRAFSPHF